MKIRRFAFIAALLSLFCSELYAGHLKAILTPSQAVTAGARWQVDGGAWKNSGATVKNLSNTIHTVTFKPVNGWVTPAPVNVAITNGTTTTVMATYVQTAALKIDLTPASGQWRLDGGAWQTSGTTTTGLPPGSHLVEYAGLAGYASPTTENVTLVAGQTTTLARNYTQLARVSIVLTPATGTWRVDGGAWLNSEATATDIPPGSHSIEYGPLAGYIAPPPETVTLAPNQDLALARAYTELASLTVTLAPAQGQWRLDGGAWNASGATLPNLIAGDHLIEYADLVDYIAPTAEVISLAAGAAQALHRSYVAAPAFAIVHAFDDAGNLPTAILGSDGWIYYAASSGESNGLGVLYRVQPDGTQRELLLRFGFAPVTGLQPKALIEGSDGVLYGTTLSGEGGTSTVSNGTIYRVNRDGTGYATLYVVSGTNWGRPNSLVEGLDGNLYGTTTATGPSGANGKLFRISKDGSGFTVLRSLFSNEGSNPQGLLQAPSGTLYGTAKAGGASGLGSIFKLNPDGSGFGVLKSFLGGIDGSDPRARLTLGSDGLLYGTSYGGGTANRGLVFRINPDGSGFEVLRHFLGATTDAFGPESALVEEADGMIYGTTSGGGPANRGTIFRLNKDGSNYSVVCTFAGGINDGAFPRVELVPLGGGRFLGGTNSFGSGSRGVFYTVNTDGTGFTTILQLGSPGGAEPWTSVTEADGVLYGVTHTGGSAAAGTIFRVNRDGTDFTVLKSFTGSAEGTVPIGALCAASDGLLYGTTYTNSKLFKIGRDGTGFTILQNFGAVGLTTWSGVIEASDSFLYGVTYGTVYRIAKSGTDYSTLHTFTNASTDGDVACGWLTEGIDGRLYGTTYSGGSANQGVVYAMNKDGSGFVVLHHFAGGGAGAQPIAGLLQTTEGTLFGTTTLGGTANRGAIFKLNPDGSAFAVIKSFTAGLTDGADPTLSSVVEKNGQLYGVTTKGGQFDGGTVYRINKDGSGHEILVNFGVDDVDAIYPWANLTKGSDGMLYGTTTRGGPVAGTIFFLRPN